MVTIRKIGPSDRDSWIGRRKALIRSAEDFALQSGFTELASDAEINNHISIEIHNHLGFIKVEKTVHFIKSLIPGNT
jgi:aminoglycoside 6'-N-acetyltransferase I